MAYKLQQYTIRTHNSMLYELILSGMGVVFISKDLHGAKKSPYRPCFLKKPSGHGCQHQNRRRARQKACSTGPERVPSYKAGTRLLKSTTPFACVKQQENGGSWEEVFARIRALNQLWLSECQMQCCWLFFCFRQTLRLIGIQP